MLRPSTVRVYAKYLCVCVCCIYAAYAAYVCPCMCTYMKYIVYILFLFIQHQIFYLYVDFRRFCDQNCGSLKYWLLCMCF